MNKDKIYVKHILDTIDAIESHISGIDEVSFHRNKLVQGAVMRELEIIGEAAKRLSDEFRDKYAHIPWKEIAGMRDKLIHDYFSVDLDEVWKTVQGDLLELREALR